MINFAFFGTPDRAAIALEELKKLGHLPKVVVTQPDRPQGRKLVLTPPPAKVWALENGIPVLQPEKIDDAFLAELAAYDCELFVVVAYGKIVPRKLLDMPKHGAINLHASLLPKYRGASPVETAILENDSSTGVTIIQMDEKMDHGPILATKKISIKDWPITADELARILVTEGSLLISQTIEALEKGRPTITVQDESQATYTKKITKEDGLIDPNGPGYSNYLKYKAYYGWPGVFFFVERDGAKIRVKITEAEYVEDKFIIKKVVPEGKKEMTYQQFLKG